MKLYKKENKILIQNEELLYSLADQDWDIFINDDQLFEKIQSAIAGATPLGANDFRGIQPPIAGQELWASGVTYFRSKQGREEESKETEVLFFIPKSMMPPDLSCSLKRQKIEFQEPTKRLELEETLLERPGTRAYTFCDC